MRHRRRDACLLPVLLLVAVGCASATTVCGCHPENCRDTVTCPSEPSKPACVGDPAAGEATEECGIFASSSLGDDANPGTRKLPVRTLARALDLAQAGPGRVYACAEEFAEAVTISGGIELRGGLDCANGWAYLGGDDRTIVAPEPDRIPLRFVAGDGVAIASDVRAVASDAVQPGGSAIAALAAKDAAVEILRSELIAGDGAHGEPGAPGDPTFQPAQSGAPGASGMSACSADVIAGGASVSTICGTVITSGGEGGEGNLSAGGSGLDGQPEPVPNPQGLGLGGAGESGAQQCLPGQDGANGEDALHGHGAFQVAARIGSLGWMGAWGEDGGDGRPGQGGGGGGGSRGGSLFCGLADTPKGGASGGSGGAGGCGGRGGKGGGPGGASIGIVILSAEVFVHSTTIRTGNGGDGGVGGMSQLGGSRGVPGEGGLGVNGSRDGCSGGWGGRGGNGGYGGGGLGGSSIGIAHWLGLPLSMDDLLIETGEAGRGGEGGNPAVVGSEGEEGATGDMLGFPQ
ncbi:MAG: hypothetical protein IT372_34425 [Polyangiaceae bacterium]|nr:hypothetical protein [Polyangiaceae bacterium]